MLTQHGRARKGPRPHAGPTLDHRRVAQLRKQSLGLGNQIIKLAIRLIGGFKISLTGRSNGHRAIQMRHHMQPFGKQLRRAGTRQIQQGSLPFDPIANLFAQVL